MAMTWNRLGRIGLGGLYAGLAVACCSGPASADTALLQHFWLGSQGVSGCPATILRIDQDVTGDGLPEVFLANSQLSGNSGIDGWFVYAPTGEEGHYRFLGRLGFNYRRFRVQSSPPELLVWLSVDGAVGDLVAHRVSSSGLVEASRQVAVPVDEIAEGFELWREETGLRVLAIEAVRMREAQPPWVDLLTGEELSGVSRLDGLNVVDFGEPQT